MDTQEFALQRECTIIHEAAHAVVARSWGWEITSIDADWQSFPIIHLQIPELDIDSFKHAEVCLVGPMSECILAGCDWRLSDAEVRDFLSCLDDEDDEDDEEEHNIQSDFDVVFRILTATYGTDEATFLQAYRRFEAYVHEQLINEHWPAILTQYRELGGKPDDCPSAEHRLGAPGET